MKLTNNYKRSLGIVISPATEAIVLEVGASADISEADYASLQENATTKKWLDDGIISVSVDGDYVVAENHAEPEPDDNDAEKPADVAVVKHLGAGRYNVFVGEDAMSEKPLDKEAAEAMAAEYNAPGAES